MRLFQVAVVFDVDRGFGEGDSRLAGEHFFSPLEQQIALVKPLPFGDEAGQVQHATGLGWRQFHGAPQVSFRCRVILFLIGDFGFFEFVFGGPFAGDAFRQQPRLYRSPHLGSRER